MESIKLISEMDVLKRFLQGASMEQLIKSVKTTNKVSQREAKNMVERTLYDYQMRENKKGSANTGQGITQTTSNVDTDIIT